MKPSTSNDSNTSAEISPIIDTLPSDANGKFTHFTSTYEVETVYVTEDPAFSSDTKLMDSPNPRIQHQGQEQLDSYPEKTQSRHFVKWGVQWNKHPIYMVFFAFGGLILAAGHHTMNSLLDGTEAGDKQQWSSAFGTAFAFLVATSLHRAISSAYNQHLWMLVRGRSFTLGALDKLFALTMDPSGFFDIEVLWHGTFSVAIAFFCWTMPLAALLPPGTLIVINAPANHDSQISMPSLNWTSEFWSSKGEALPTALVSSIGTRAAEDMSILPFSPPSLNSSYTLPIRGPFVQCDTANSTQAPLFEHYRNALLRDGFITAENWNSTSSETAQGRLLISAFDPFLSKTLDSSSISTAAAYVPDQFNNWPVDLPQNFYNSTGYFLPNCKGLSCQKVPLQLWVQTANDSFVCTMGNATRQVHFDFVNGAQVVSYDNAEAFDPVYVGRASPTFKTNPEVHAYVSVYMSMTNMLSGNITDNLDIMQPSIGSTIIHTMGDNPSRILLTSLDACDDFKSYWDNHPVAEILDTNSSTPTWAENATALNAPSIFTKPAGMCRNRTLAKSIEDLATNITISMLTAPDLLSPNSTTTTMTVTASHNIYRYNPVNLLISYGIAVFFAMICVSLGLYAFHTNGVTHSTALSAIIATTRNPALDDLSRGHSLGTLPLDKEVETVRLRFGVMVGEGGKWSSQIERHVAFGIEGEVVGIRKGGEYT